MWGKCEQATLPEEHQNHCKIRKTGYNDGEKRLDVRQRQPSIGRKDE